MGMKIRQESRVRTFFKKIFRFPKKDKEWKHKKLDNNVAYTSSNLSVDRPGSADSFDNGKPNIVNGSERSRESLNNGKRNEANIAPHGISGYGEDFLDGAVEGKLEENILNTEAKKKNIKKKWKVKVNLKETKLVEIKQYEAVDEPEASAESSIKRVKKSKKNNKSKITGSLDNAPDDLCNTVNDEQELVDVDFNLVLSSFANLRNASQERNDNLANERLTAPSSRQGAAPAGVEVTVDEKESTAIGDTSAEATPDAINPKNNKKSRRRNGAKNNTLKQKSEPKPTEKRRKTKQKKTKGDYECIEDETFQSIELIISKNRAELPPLFDEEDSDISEPQQELTKTSLKRNKKKKKKNVRCPEDDFEDELSRDPSKRRKHQDLCISDVIADLGTPAESVEHVAAKGKKLRRRRLKVKFNKDKKKLDVKRYDELNQTKDVDAEVTRKEGDGQTTAREVGRRMWRACKTGWKYMKAGLVYYTRAPGNAGNFNPVIRRYEDGFEAFGDPSTSTGRSKY